MLDWSIASTEAVVICTRNRPDELALTLQSVAEQSSADERPVLVVDGSDPEKAASTADVVRSWAGLPFHYHRYSGKPAGTRQRNAGVDLLPPPVQIVHFIDDDVILKEGYFDQLSAALEAHPSLLGVGGIVLSPKGFSSPSDTTWLHHLFLLSTSSPSQVLPSGQTTPAWPSAHSSLQPADWLSTCASSYRRCVFQNHRFDPEAEGPSPRLEDLDFSFRVAREGPLAVVPEARCVHRVSSKNRRTAAGIAGERVVRRYWFVRKNMNTPAHRLAYWWSIIGRLIICALSSNPDSNAYLHGLIQGIRTVWTRNHPLLRAAEGT